MKEFITWKQFDKAIDEFIKDYTENDYKCDYIYGPPRGGLPLAVALSHRLDLPIIESIDTYWIHYSRPRTKMLVVDDIADTGETLKPLVGPNIISYTIYYHQQSIVEPDCWIFEKKDDWIVFPWETKDSDMIQDYLKGEVNA